MRRAIAVLGLAAALATSLAAQGKADALREFREGRYEEARQICVAELSVDASNIESYVVICWSLIALEKFGDAELYASKGLAYRKDPRLLEAMGEICYFLGKNDQALSYLQGYIIAVPEGDRIDRAYFYMGEVFVRTGKYSHADIAFSVALTFAPRNARYWARAGYARERVGDLSPALQAYEKAIELNPDLQDARMGRDRVLALLAD